MAVYLNVYEVWQCYGGPDEGGWFFDAGSPLESTLISDLDYDNFFDEVSPEEREELRETAKLKWVGEAKPTPKKTGYGGYTFMPGSDEPITYKRDNDIRVCFEAEFAEPFPEQRPHYE